MILFSRDVVEDIKTLTVTSSAFIHYGYIPTKYTCDGNNVNPSLRIKNIPKHTKSLAIIVEDTDAPIRTWIHWLVWNVKLTHFVKENVDSNFGISGIIDFRKTQYVGPCPISGIHHYHFKVYALDDLLDLPIGVSKIELEKAMSRHIIAFGELVGLYKAKKS